MILNLIILSFNSAQLALLNSSNDIKRSDLDLLEKQLAIQKTQAELESNSNERNIRQLSKNSAGEYQWGWVSDQTKTLALQGTLYQEQQDLAKTKLDNQNNADQLILNQKSEYLANIKTVVDNAQNGEYASTTEFHDAMTSANTGFLTSLQDSNSTTWATISSDVSNNLDTIISAYTTYVSQMSGLQSQANSLASSITNSGSSSSGSSSGSSYSGSNGNTSDMTITKNGSYNQDTGNYTITKPDGSVTTGNGSESDYEKKFSSFDTGGTNNKTGLAMLHGTNANTETIFNATDGKKLWDFVHNLDITSILKNIDVTKIMENLKIPKLDLSNIKLPSNNLTPAGNSYSFSDFTIVANNPTEMFSQIKAKVMAKIIIIKYFIGRFIF